MCEDVGCPLISWKTRVGTNKIDHSKAPPHFLKKHHLKLEFFIFWFLSLLLFSCIIYLHIISTEFREIYLKIFVAH